jgi:hypothetical protein
MVQIVMALIRVFVGLLLGCIGMLSAMAGLYFLARQNARPFGSEGVLLLLGLAVAAMFGVGSWKLLGHALRPRPATDSRYT